MMACNWDNSDFEQFSSCDQFLELDYFDEGSASLEQLIKEETTSELRDSNYEDQFYSPYDFYSMRDDCSTEDFLRNSPTATLAELNGQMVDNLELLDSVFIVKPGLIPDNARQVKCHKSMVSTQNSVEDSDMHSRSDTKSSNHRLLPLVRLKSEVTATGEELSPTVSVNALTVKSEVHCKSEEDIKASISVLVDAVPSKELDCHTKEQQFFNVRVKCREDVCEPKSSCEKSSPQTAQRKVLPVIVKMEPPCKKLKTENDDAMAIIKKECSWSPANGSDDSDIENFDDTVSDDDSAMASTGENLNDTVLASCSGVDAQKRYFWLYNVQAKGPKGRQSSTLLQVPETSGFIDPHVLHSLDDPTHCDVSARGRRTRGSDIDANPRRLLQIGAEIHRLSSVVNRSPAAAEASLSPREKNKYASRICRLKRKAQHEANKIKLQGLDKEHHQLMNVLVDIKASIVQKVREMPRFGDPKLFALSARSQPTLTSKLESLVQTHLSDMIAEHTNEYVSCELQKVKNDSRSQRV